MLHGRYLKSSCAKSMLYTKVKKEETSAKDLTGLYNKLVVMIKNNTTIKPVDQETQHLKLST